MGNETFHDWDGFNLKEGRKLKLSENVEIKSIGFLVTSNQVIFLVQFVIVFGPSGVQFGIKKR